MARERKGYVQERKDGSIWARVTYVGDDGKRRELRRRAEMRLMRVRSSGSCYAILKRLAHNRLKATVFDSVILPTFTKRRSSFRLSITEGERLPV